MKFHILAVSDRYQPGELPHRYPRHNKHFGIEQDFHAWLLRHPEMLTNDPDQADWHYLPIYWTRWHVSHDYAKTGRAELQEEVNRVVRDDKRTFTICQYADGPLMKMGKAVVYLSSRTATTGHDAPLLSEPHRFPWFMPKRKYTTSFVGRLHTHPIRHEMKRVLKPDAMALILNWNLGTRWYVRIMLKSYTSLCPRGYGGGSFRFFEAMQLGVAPIMLGDIDVRPFKQQIAWDQISVFTSNPQDLPAILASRTPSEWVAMGQRARDVWYNSLWDSHWCDLLINELETTDAK